MKKKTGTKRTLAAELGYKPEDFKKYLEESDKKELAEQAVQYAAPMQATKPDKNLHLQPSQIENWRQFWMVYVSHARPPQKMYHSLAEAMTDADALATKENKKAFIVECIGVICPPSKRDQLILK